MTVSPSTPGSLLRPGKAVMSVPKDEASDDIRNAGLGIGEKVWEWLDERQRSIGQLHEFHCFCYETTSPLSFVKNYKGVIVHYI